MFIFFCTTSVIADNSVASSTTNPGDQCSVTIQQLSFGSIDLNPGGSSVVINASSGNGTINKDGSVITGWQEGRLTITCAEMVYVSITYPNSVTLSSGQGNITMDKIQEYSQYGSTGIDFPGDETRSVRVGIGGRLVLQGDESHAPYSGTIHLILNYQ